MSDQRHPNPPRSHAEETDASKLGEEAGAVDRAGDVYPPDEPLGVEDAVDRAGLVEDPDSVSERAAREEPELAPVDDRVIGHDLLDPSDDPDHLDDEAQAVARRGTDADTAAEVAAVRDEVDSGSPRPTEGDQSWPSS